jgi:hypothetical protein
MGPTAADQSWHPGNLVHARYLLSNGTIAPRGTFTSITLWWRKQ